MGTVAVSNMHQHLHPPTSAVQTVQQQHILVTHAAGPPGPGSTTGSATPGVDEQPQDLTPAQEQNSINNSGSNTPTAMQQQSMLTSTPVSQAGTPGGSASNSPTTPTSAAAMAAAAAAAQHKKDRNSRKNCTYCHKVSFTLNPISDDTIYSPEPPL